MYFTTHNNNKSEATISVMTKESKNNEVCKANSVQTIETLKGFSKIAKVGETYTTPDGTEFTVEEIANNLVIDGKRQGLQMSLIIDETSTGLKRPEVLSKILGLVWERESRSESVTFSKVMTDEEITTKANEVIDKWSSYFVKIETLKRAQAEFIAKYGNNPTFEGVEAYLRTVNEETRQKTAKAKEKAEVQAAMKGKKAKELAAETISLNSEIERLRALLAASGLQA